MHDAMRLLNIDASPAVWRATMRAAAAHRSAQSRSLRMHRRRSSTPSSARQASAHDEQYAAQAANASAASARSPMSGLAWGCAVSIVFMRAPMVVV
jgi:hypothetical protein